MEAGRSLVSPPPQFPLRSHLRNCAASSFSVLLLHEQVTPALTSLSSTSLARHPSASALILDQQNENRLSLSLKEDSKFQQTTLGSSLHERSKSDDDDDDDDQYMSEFQLQLQSRTEIWHLWSSLLKKEHSFPTTTESTSSKSEKLAVIEEDSVVALAREALSACKMAASIANDVRAHHDDSYSIRGLANVPVQSIVRSTRLQERQAKRRKVPKPKVEIQEPNHRRKPESSRKFEEEFGPNDPIRLFLRMPESTKLLTAKEESALIVDIQEFMKLQEVKSEFEKRVSREPTLVEWAAAVGISCQVLKSKINCGNSSREKLIYANFRMVVHIAKKYQGRGLTLQDLLQEGSKGLMTSVEKFKPQSGCRFATYAYWWIRQSVRKAIFQHSRTIRLPENVYGLLSKVYQAKRLCIQQGNHHPTQEDIAQCAGITVEKLNRLMFTARMPLSMQKPIWFDQDTTYQEITADTTIESPDVGIAKQMMRQHVQNLLSVLDPRERKIIQLRFGINRDGKQRTLSEIGATVGLCKERVRQLESRALHKLRECFGSQGLVGYADLLL